MKRYKIMFWVATTLIFLLEGVLSILTMHSPMAIKGVTSLGYPVYFVTILATFKFLGGLALIIPQVPIRFKEWAYAGFGIDFICAFISIVVVTGFNVGALITVLAMVILIVSYMGYHNM